MLRRLQQTHELCDDGLLKLGQKDPCKIHTDNINAAIQYHKSLPKHELCSPIKVYFQNAKLVEKIDASGPIWSEVSTCSFRIMSS
jgi:hypothetical protein